MTSIQHNHDHDRFSCSSTAGMAAGLLLSLTLDRGLRIVLPGGCRRTTCMHAGTYSLGTYSPTSSISGRPLLMGAATGHWLGLVVASMALPSRGRPTLGSVAADLHLGLDRPFGHTHPRYGRWRSTAHTSWSLRTCLRSSW